MSLPALAQVPGPAPAPAVVGCGPLEAVAGRYIIRARTLTGELATESESLVDKLLRENPSSLIHRTDAVSAQNSQLTQSSPQSVMTLAAQLSDDEVSELVSDTKTLSVEQDCIVHVEALPNDPLPSAYQFPRDSLNLAKAWDLRTATDSIVVAVSDTGVDYTHEDLAANIWTNQSEQNGHTGIDDDANGCIDDIHGCDFGDYDGDPKPFQSTEGDHGTHVAGIIGAVGGNARGVNGVAWSTQLMAVKGFDSGGNARVSDLLNTVYYAVNNGARVINCSWGANRTPTQTEVDAFNFALSKGVLPVVAAGNSSADAASFSPAAIDGVLSVGSVNSNDRVSGFSNFGSHVLVYATGGDALAAGGTLDEFIYSTLPVAHGSYGTLRGTSMAAPFVAGIAALVFAANPLFSAADVRNIIVASSRHVTSVLPNGASATIAIPDAFAALVMAASYIPTPTSVPTSAPTKPAGSSVGVNPPQGTASYDAGGGCALKHGDAPPPFSVVIFLVPLAFAYALKRSSFLA